jgi:hypothetical protein
MPSVSLTLAYTHSIPHSPRRPRTPLIHQHPQVCNTVPLAPGALSLVPTRVVFLPTYALAALSPVPRAHPLPFYYPARTRGYARTYIHAEAHIMYRARPVSAPPYLAASTSACSPSASKLSEPHQQQQQQQDMHPALPALMRCTKGDDFEPSTCSGFLSPILPSSTSSYLPRLFLRLLRLCPPPGTSLPSGQR